MTVRRGHESFCLSEWALAHKNFVLYLMILTLILGIYGYNRLGQAEDPPFTFKVMLVQAIYRVRRHKKWKSKSPTV